MIYIDQFSLTALHQIKEYDEFHWHLNYAIPLAIWSLELLLQITVQEAGQQGQEILNECWMNLNK